METEQMPAVLQASRVAAVVPMGRSATLARSVTGGVLVRALQIKPGTAFWAIPMAKLTGAITTRVAVFLCGASGIDLPACLRQV